MRRSLAYLFAWFAGVGATVAVAARYVPVVNHAVLIVAALSPYLAIAGSLAAAALLFAYSPPIAAVALLPAVVAVALQLPLFIGSGGPAADTVAIRVLTANLKEGLAEPQPLADLAHDRADVVVVQELTPELSANLNMLKSDFPFQAVAARPYAAGVGIWSRYPIEHFSRNTDYELGMLTASLRVPGAASAVTVLAAHVMGPWPQPIDGWRREMALLPKTLATLADITGSGAAIVAGDLNATSDMAPFRRLLRDGFRSAVEQAGAGLVPTFPSGRSMPPIIGIDHIITRNSSVSDVSTVYVPGSDHLGLIATVHVRRQVNTG